MELKQQIIKLPQRPGVYLMKNSQNKIIYIGKAKNIKKRVSSYFQKKALDIKTTVLTNNVSYIDFIITENEIEALILEDNLIKKHLPRYNVNLKDDKRYPYVKITIDTEDYPCLTITRERLNDKDLYFGPYASGVNIRDILKLINRIFPIRKCTKKLNIKKKNNLWLKPVGKYCLYHQLKQCMGPCQGTIDPEEYKKNFHQIILFLKGEDQKLHNEMEEQMKQLSDKMKYEQAQLIKERLISLKKVMEKQKIVSSSFNSKDIFMIIQRESTYNITILFIREGKMTGKDNFIIHNKVSPLKQILNDFIKQFYIDANIIPEEIITPFPIEDRMLLQKILKQNNKPIKIKIPKDPLNKKLLLMAQENAEITLNNYFADMEYKNKRKELKVLKQELHLKREPEIIEGFDISNIQGELAVGSMVRFTKGIPDKKEYRKFKIKTVEGIDDFKMMYEVVYRRYNRLKKENKELPDLILIDGGKGQLHSAQKALNELHLNNQPILSLAKKEEIIFQTHKEDGLKLSKANPGLKLLQRVRDEAHRFAIQYHKLLRKKEMIPQKTKKRI